MDAAERQSLNTAAILTAVIAAEIAAVDVWLLRHQRASITEVLRTRTGRATLAVICLHVVDVLGVVDPFSALGKRITGGKVRLP
jgi:hypothetical protein